jgi:acetolactate synthase-1/2/3 large subunit
MKMTVSDYVGHFLHVQGVTDVFEVVGGMITFLLDSLYRQGQLRIVSMHHEQAAAFAVDGQSRITSRPAVAMATSGPGATNLLTGIGSCYFDSVPAVFITGQVNRHELKGNRAIRQLGFQETDIVSMAAPITKAAWLATNPDDLPSFLAEAFRLAVSGRPGPVLVDIPMDVQRASIDVEMPVMIQRPQPVPLSALQSNSLSSLLAALTSVKRPLILAGGGVRSSQCVSLLTQWIEAMELPVVHSLMAVDVLPAGHPLRVGLIGSYGNRWANHALGHTDLLLVLGSRLDVRQTGADTESFSTGKRIFHVDCDAGELNNRLSGCEIIHSELQPFLQTVRQETKTFQPPDEWKNWRDAISDWQDQWPDTAELNDVPGINPNQLMRQLSTVAQVARVFSVDVGQHQMWAAQSLQLNTQQRFITSGGMGAMGFSLPAAIGAAFAVPGEPVVVIAGDGSFQLNIQELQTIARNRLPIKMVVLDNECHGMVRQFQESYFDSRYQSTCWGYSAPDFAAVAQAYGIPAISVEEPTALNEALQQFWADPLQAALLHVKIATAANAYPKMAFGRPITEMEPFAKPIAMEST